MKFIDRAKLFFKKSITSSQFLPSYRVGRPVETQWHYGNAVKHGYKRSATVYSCVNMIAKSAASVQWKTYKRSAKGVWEEVPDHPLTLLIEKPNPFMSQKDFIERMTHSLYLGGNSVFSKVRGTNNAVVEMWYLPQDMIKPVPDQRKFISHYVFKNEAGKEIKIPTKDILHNQFLNPSDLYWGISPVKAAAEIIDTDNEAIRWNRYSMQQRAISDGAFILDQPLNRDQWKEAREQITEQHTGAENGRAFWVLGAGAKWQPMSMSPAEMDFIESRKMNKEEICSIFGVPPVMIGIYENATLANIETGRKIFWLDTILPYLSDVRNCLNATLASEYGEDIKLDFDTSTIDAIQENVGEKINNAKTLFAMGIPFNQINQKLDLGFDEIDGGEVGFLPSNLIPIEAFTGGGLPAAQNEPQTEPQTDETDTEKGNTRRSLKDLSQGEYDTILKKREFYWKSKEVQRAPYDIAMTNKAAAIFKDMGEKVSKAYRDSKDIGRAIKAHKKEWETLYEFTYKQIFDDIGLQEVRDILDQAKAYDPRSATKADNELETLINDQIKKWITLTAASKVTGVLEFTKADIAALILELEEKYQEEDYSVSVDVVAKAIEEKFTDFSRYRAYRIARTEVAGASEAATFEGQKEAQRRIDPTGKKMIIQRQWITARDERVRESHAKLDGKTIDLDGSFNIYRKNEQGEWIETEDTLKFPADYVKDEPGETINCRCTTKSILVKV
jgi:HK97 family phage portal protein